MIPRRTDIENPQLGKVPEETIRKVLEDTPARIYGVEV